MSFIFNELLVRPLFNILVSIYNILPGNDFGVAIIILTVLIKLAMSPLSVKMFKSQRQLAKLQPKIKEIQEKYKDNPTEASRATMQVYKDNKTNPFSGCLPMLIQIPLIWAIYKVFSLGLNHETLDLLYGFVNRPAEISKIAFGFLDLSMSSHVLAISAGAFQFLQSRIMTKYQEADSVGQEKNPALQMTRQMLYFFPIMIVFISWNLPSALALYWTITAMFSTVEQVYIRKTHT